MAEVFVDMDGVLCDFVGAAMNAHGAVYDPKTYPVGEWDIAKVLGISNTEFWRKLEGKDFWANLEPYPWAFELLDGIREMGHRVTLATSPSLDPQCAAGKTEWICKHLGDGTNRPRFRDYFIGSQKDRLAGPDRVLIDDNDETVVKFCDAGGFGILFPQRWNSLYCRCRMPHVEVLEMLEQEYEIS